MTRQEFIELYTTQYLATYMAVHYDDDCMNGHPGRRYENQPVEDAKFCAGEAWELLQKMEVF